MFQTILFVVSMVSPVSVPGSVPGSLPSRDAVEFNASDTGASELPAVAMLGDTMLPDCDSAQSVTMFAPADALYMRTYDWTFSKSEKREIDAAFRNGASRVDVCLSGSSIKVR